MIFFFGKSRYEKQHEKGNQRNEGRVNKTNQYCSKNKISCALLVTMQTKCMTTIITTNEYYFEILILFIHS